MAKNKIGNAQALLENFFFSIVPFNVDKYSGNKKGGIGEFPLNAIILEERSFLPSYPKRNCCFINRNMVL